MSREILVLWAGRHRRKSWDELCADYRRRIAREMPVRRPDGQGGRGGDDRGACEAEGEALRRRCPTLLVDRARSAGQPSSSEDLASELLRLREEWPHPIAFLIGSDLGLPDSVLRGVRRRLSFGKMVFGHELARLVLYEQLYRSISIGKGIKYHRF